MIEEWLPIAGYEDRYEVSNLGRLRSLRYRSNGGVVVMKATPNYAKYNVVTLGVDRKQCRVAVLVLEAFVGPRPGPNYDACHGPAGNTVDWLSNLRWDTKQGNMSDRISYVGDANPNAKLTNLQMLEAGLRKRNGEAATLLAAEYGISTGRIYQLARELNSG